MIIKRHKTVELYCISINNSIEDAGYTSLVEACAHASVGYQRVRRLMKQGRATILSAGNKIDICRVRIVRQQKGRKENFKIRAKGSGNYSPDFWAFAKWPALPFTRDIFARVTLYSLLSWTYARSFDTLNDSRRVEYGNSLNACVTLFIVVNTSGCVRPSIVTTNTNLFLAMVFS